MSARDFGAVTAATQAGANLIGKAGLEPTKPGTTNAVALPDGANVTFGAKAEAAAATDTGAASSVALVKRGLGYLGHSPARSPTAFLRSRRRSARPSPTAAQSRSATLNIAS